MDDHEIRAEGGNASLLVDRHVYSRESLLQACYWFTDRAYLLISRSPDERYKVYIQPKSEETADAQLLAGELANALLDAQLRQQVIEQTGRIREIIFAKAFAEGGLLDDLPPGDDRDPVEIRRDDSVGSQK